MPGAGAARGAEPSGDVGEVLCRDSMLLGREKRKVERQKKFRRPSEEAVVIVRLTANAYTSRLRAETALRRGVSGGRSGQRGWIRTNIFCV